jgi:hypothetical protein
MSKYPIILLIMVIISSFSINSIQSKLQQPASNYIHLYEKYEGSPGNIIYNYYSSNTSNSKIRIVVKLTNTPPDGQSYTQVFIVNPNESIYLANKTSDGAHYTYIALVSAEYIN